MERAKATIEDARVIAARFPGIGTPERIERWGSGLINDTFAVDGGEGRFVLQRVHPVFAPEIHLDIVAVTEQLAARGIATPLLLKSDQGRPWIEAGGIWRVQTRLPGVTFDRVESLEQARSAGAVLGRFHRALVDLEHEFVGLRQGVHDTSAHMSTLETRLQEHLQHPLHPQVEPLATEIFTGAEALPRFDQVPSRIVHGDPKFNNVLFEGEGPRAREHALALVDLDTVGPMALHLELGDMWRSWCNRAGEDATEASFDLHVFEASLQGWSESRPFRLEPSEQAALLHGVEWITLELATRFAVDALAESYFGWDSTRYSRAGEHNLVRARGQWNLHRAVLDCRSEREQLLRRYL